MNTNIKNITNQFLNNSRKIFGLFTLLMGLMLSGCSDIEKAIEASSGNQLTALSVSGATLSPAFSSTVSNYSATVPFSTSAISIQTTADTGAGVTVNGTAFNGSGTFDLTVGSNVFTVVVTASDGTSTYTLTITREAASTNADLSALMVLVGALTPAFDSQTNAYTVSVSSETDSTTVTASSDDSNASITVNSTAVTSGTASGSIAINVGDNVINVEVTAEDGTTTKTYTVTITRAAPLSDDADLSILTLSVGSLTPTFDSATLTYIASVNFTTTSITATPTLSDINASVTVNGTLTDSGTASSAINLDEGDNNITLVVLAEDDTTTQTYTVTVTRQATADFAQQAYIKASNTDADDRFGFSVALDGDTLAVGAYQEESNATGINQDETNNDSVDSGAVYVFTRSGGSWSQQAYIKSTNTDSEDEFGRNIALNGDTLAVGAICESSNATGIDQDETNNDAVCSGAVYIFTRSGITWIQQAYIKASNTDVGDRFGSSIALDGDTLAVGAYREQSNATGIDGDETNNDVIGSGAVYVFTRSGITWAQQAYIKASNTDVGDQFGLSGVVLDGDTLAVGAYREQSNATGINGDESNNDLNSSGAVYVFTRSGSTWTQQAYIKASNTDTFDWFGFSVALNGDTLAVAANQEDGNTIGIGQDEANNDANGAGAVYVFTRSGSTWTQQAYIKASNTDANDNFGRSVALDGDTLLVGAIGENSNATGIDGDETNNDANDSGAVYVFTRSGSTWTQQAYIKASNTDIFDNFMEVALDGDTLAVGAISEGSNATDINGDQGDNSATNAGAIYLFNIPPSGNGN